MSKRDVTLEQLNHLQRYVGTEMVDMYREGRLVPIDPPAAEAQTAGPRPRRI
jgi:hypothetical protein